MARFCGKCGSAASDKATFCNKCGERLLLRRTVRYSYDEKEKPVNPYKGGETEAPTTKGGVSKATRKPGVKVPPTLPQQPSTPSTSSTSGPAAGDTSRTSESSPWSAPERPLYAALDEDPITKAKATVRNFSLWAAGIVLMPIPFGDLVLLIPVQSAMILSVARIFGVQDPPEKILAYIAATSGVSVFGQVTMLIVANLFPIVGKLVSAPFIYGWTYGLGEVAIRYFQSQGQISGDEMKAVFKQAAADAKKSFKREKKVDRDEALDNLKEHLSEDEYSRIRNKFADER